MKRLPCLILTFAFLSPFSASARAQNPTSSEELQKKLDSTVELLKDAQDRKNELRIENQQLQKRIAELEHQAARSDIPDAAHGNLRVKDPLWRAFLQMNPGIDQMWTVFANASESSDRIASLLGIGNWPFGLD